tara:strand:+ start:102 stop:473 length:372 start_codon:yes stop_codon:yes gene_type:complete
MATILLVDDDGQLRELIRWSFEAAGHTVLDAADGEDAVAVARGRGAPLDVLVADIVMPRMGGYAVAEQVCSLHPETQTLYISGYVDLSRQRRDGQTEDRPQLSIEAGRAGAPGRGDDRNQTTP